MSAPTAPRVPSRAWLLALLAGLIIFLGRSALVFYAGSPVPFHDQWIAEAQQLLVPDAHHALTWRAFFLPHSDHLVLATRLIAFGLYRLAGSWDMLAEMLVNNALIAAAFAYLLFHVRRASDSLGVAIAALVFALWLGSPLFYGNALWGFQSSIELLVLTALVQLVATCAIESIGFAWWFAAIAGVIGAVSFGSGLFASVAAALVCLVRSRESHRSRPALMSACMVNLAIAAGGLLVLLRSPTLGHGGPRLADVLHTARHAFSWPAMQPDLLGLAIWLPAIVATVLLVIRRRALVWLPALALAWWAALQIAGIAVLRSTPVPALAPRYYDIFAVGIVANALLWRWFITSADGVIWLRAPLVALALGWCGWVGWAGVAFARSHAVHDLPAVRVYAEGQISVLQRYYHGEGRAALTGAQFPVLPYPEPAYLENLLADPAIRAALPAQVREPAPPGSSTELLDYRWPDRGPTRFVWLGLCLGLLAAAAACFVLVLVGSARSSTSTPPTPAQPT